MYFHTWRPPSWLEQRVYVIPQQTGFVWSIKCESGVRSQVFLTHTLNSLFLFWRGNHCGCKSYNTDSLMSSHKEVGLKAGFRHSVGIFGFQNSCSNWSFILHGKVKFGNVIVVLLHASKHSASSHSPSLLAGALLPLWFLWTRLGPSLDIHLWTTLLMWCSIRE